MIRTTPSLFCRTCRQLRLVLAQVRTLRRPFAPQAEQTQLVYLCRACGATLASAPAGS